MYKDTYYEIYILDNKSNKIIVNHSYKIVNMDQQESINTKFSQHSTERDKADQDVPPMFIHYRTIPDVMDGLRPQSRFHRRFLSGINMR